MPDWLQTIFIVIGMLAVFLLIIVIFASAANRSDDRDKQEEKWKKIMVITLKWGNVYEEIYFESETSDDSTARSICDMLQKYYGYTYPVKFDYFVRSTIADRLEEGSIRGILSRIK